MPLKRIQARPRTAEEAADERRVRGLFQDRPSVEALIERGQLQQIFVMEDSHARLRMITAGRRANGRVEVLSGLNAGDQVIVPVPAGLADSARVEVRQ